MNTMQAVFWALSGVLAAGTVILLLRPLGPHGTANTAILWGVPALALGLYLVLGRPDMTSWRTGPSLPPYIAASVTKLTNDVEANPNDLQGWILLGDVYARIRRYDQAASCYRRAAELDPATPLYAAMVGQMLVKAGGDKVGPEAQSWFDKAKDEPLSRYYGAEARAQAGDWAGAKAGWLALRQDKGADPAWQAMLGQRLEEADKALGKAGH